MTDIVAETQLSEVAVASPAPLDAGVAVVLLAAIGVFAWIARRVTTKTSQPLDQGVREAVQSHRVPALDVATKPVTLLSMPLLVVSATAALVWWLRDDGRSDAALSVGFTPLVAAALGQSFTTFLEQRNPPDTGDAPNGEVREPSFPSGHTTGVTAEALGIAWILSREKLATPGIIAGLVAWPLLVGVTRVYRDRHWISDVLGGWVAGAGVAALAALIYEWRRNSAPNAAA
jgi:membrane-associated phospholipid phosphatase